MQNIVIDDIVTSFTDRISSHRAAWPRMQACMFQHMLDVKPSIAFGDSQLAVNSDLWLVSTPMEFHGDAFNLFGGFTEPVRDRIERLLHVDSSRLVALEKQLPNIESILRERAVKADLDFTDAQWGKINESVNARIITHESLVFSDDVRFVLGDSHSIARYRGGSFVSRNDGLTLHGLLQRGIESFLPGSFGVGHLVIAAGNIDLRHHLMRQSNPMNAALKLVGDLHYQLQHLQDQGLIKSFEVTSPYPIEFEGRRIPKTGYYKKTPFAGSREQRNDLRAAMQAKINNMFAYVYHWPSEWYDMDPELYAKTFMEKPGSVHLSPEFYEWDLVANQPRW